MKISLITVTFNRAEFLKSALDSIANQDLSTLEHIVIDGGSTDDTLDIIEHFRPNISKFVSEPDTGPYDAINKGLNIATGDVIGFLHADDFFAHQGVIADIAKVFAETPSLDAVYGDLQYVGREDVTRVVRHWRSQPFEQRLLRRGWMPPHPTLYVRREWYRRLGGFDTSYRIAADYRFILNLFSQPGLRSRYLPKVMIKMRVGGVSNRSASSLIQKSSEDWRALRESGFSAPRALVALGFKNMTKLSQFWR